MTRVYIANAKPQERSALRLLLLDLSMEVVGEAKDWQTTFAQVPKSRVDILLIDWDLLSTNIGIQVIAELRATCPKAIVVVLISHLESRQQAALSAGVDLFISTGETAERVAEHLRIVAAKISAKK